MSISTKNFFDMAELLCSKYINNVVGHKIRGKYFRWKRKVFLRIESCVEAIISFKARENLRVTE